MGMCVIVALSMVDWIWVILQVSLGLGMVIFVHELGHFAVAKMCGVKCDKFFIGFDVGGYKISHKWGETEYGIGILPLGGYVKMMGQDDDPSKIAEQMRESAVSDTNSNAKEIIGPNGETHLVDRRSYLAKSVPQRMAIISAGVVMNILFAFIFAVIAYAPCIVSQTSPGSPAWQAGIQTGDEVLKLGETENPSFSDLRGGVMLSDLEEGVPFYFRRAVSGKEELIHLQPIRKKSKLPKVGIALPWSLRLSKERPVFKTSPADLGEKGFQGEDEIVAVNGQAVKDYREFFALLVNRPSETIAITVRRGGKPVKDDPSAPSVGGKEVTIDVPAHPRHHLGLVMEMGKITAVQQGSPADEQGIQAGDFINTISNAEEDSSTTENNLYGNPVTLPERLRQLAEQNGQVRLSIRRSAATGEGRQETKEYVLPLRRVTWLETSGFRNTPQSVPSLGIAYHVLNRVDAVLPGSPAEKAGLQGNDVITQAEIIFPEKEDPKEEDFPELDPIKFGEQDQRNWPMFMEALQGLPTGTTIKLTYMRGDEKLETELSPEIVDGFFVPERGFQFQIMQRIRQASSFNQQIAWGYQETTRSLGMVYRFLQKLIEGQVPVKALGGPVTIAKVAGYSAVDGPGKLLVFLTMLSANLAVINFLPIPLLDGGHMVFLTWEGIRGRPANEKFVVALHTIGFVCIITLMLFVLGLDFNLIPRNL